MREEVWWKQITSSERFLRGIVDTLLDERNVVLYGSARMPWPHAMRSLAREALELKRGNRKVLWVDAGEIGEGLGEHLMKHSCKSELQAKYRPALGYAKFLADCETSTLPAKYIWIKNADADSTKRWIDFIRDYTGALRSRTGAVFLLEAAEGAEEAGKDKAFKTFCYEKAINHYDRFVFNLLLAAEVNVGSASTRIRQYLAELASNVTEGDVELGAECIERGKEFLADPYGALRDIRETSGLGVPKALEDTVRHAAWVAQIKQVFPLLEDYRQQFIADYEELIKKELPQPGNDGSMIEEPGDAELGLLWFLFKDKWSPISQAARDKLGKFRDARNRIAHMKLLSLEEMQELCDLYERK